MKLRAGFTLMLGSMLAVPTSTLAQSQGNCFMLGDGGQTIDLSALCGGGSGQGTLTPAGSRNPNVITVPIKRRRGGTPVIDVRFNGQSFEMLMDTGATGTAITQGMANTLQLEPEGVFLASTPSDSAVPFRTTTVKSITVNGHTRNNVEVAIAPALEIGLLGQDFYGEFDIVIKQSTIEFRRR
ncbi:MAG: retropepsin-like aspartic protease [Cyanobacteria bacterium P01_H01_bin.15]